MARDASRGAPDEAAAGAGATRARSSSARRGLVLVVLVGLSALLRASLNSRMPLPIDLPTSGRRFGPRIDQGDDEDDDELHRADVEWHGGVRSPRLTVRQRIAGRARAGDVHRTVRLVIRTRPAAPPRSSACGASGRPSAARERDEMLRATRRHAADRAQQLELRRRAAPCPGSRSAATPRARRAARACGRGRRRPRPGRCQSTSAPTGRLRARTVRPCSALSIAAACCALVRRRSARASARASPVSASAARA